MYFQYIKDYSKCKPSPHSKAADEIIGGFDLCMKVSLY